MSDFLKKTSILKKKYYIAMLIISFSGAASAAVTIPNGPYAVEGGIVWSGTLNESLSSADATWQDGTPASPSGEFQYNAASLWASYFGVGQQGPYIWDCRSTGQLNLAKSSDGLYTGIRLADDVLLVLSGKATGVLGSYSGSGTWSEQGDFVSSSLPSQSVSWCAAATASTNYTASNSSANFNGKVSLYVGKNARPGTVTIPNILLFKGFANAVAARRTLVSTSTVQIFQPRKCTVNTDNTIIFPPVDVTSTVDGQVLANKTGNLTINCNDTSNAPVTVEIQGPRGRYTDSMALTMTDGTNAPAEVRGFIGTGIPLTGQCNGRLEGHYGVVFFVPNGGLEKKSLKPGTNNYNWVLCSMGIYKTGQAKATAKMIVSWD
ncbi:hypothetical protein [Providencia sp. Me31A]|uniref:hypothetical protein n=1 Tax=Providencia sp. Me31A TaxID=3392637 RepID=UPI003D2C4405